MDFALYALLCCGRRQMNQNEYVCLHSLDYPFVSGSYMYMDRICMCIQVSSIVTRRLKTHRIPPTFFQNCSWSQRTIRLLISIEAFGWELISEMSSIVQATFLRKWPRFQLFLAIFFDRPGSWNEWRPRFREQSLELIFRNVLCLQCSDSLFYK
jgi:hypothetical protein